MPIQPQATKIPQWTPPRLTPKQWEGVRAIHDHEDTLLVMAWGAGKSVSLAFAAYLLATKWERGLAGLFFAPTLGQLQRTLVMAWTETVARPGSYRLIASGPSPRIEVPLPGGAVTTIHLLSGESYTAARIEGLNLAWVCGDELQDIDKAVWDRVVGRVRLRAAKKARRFGGGLPESGTWLEDVLVTDPVPGLKWVRGTTWDNTWNRKDYPEQLRRTLPPNLYKSRVLGEFAPPEGLVASTFDRDKHCKTSPFVPGVRLVIGQDFNNVPMASVLTQEASGVTRVVGEVVEPGTTEEQTGHLIKWCKDHEIDHRDKKQCVVVPDASGSARQHATGESDHAVFRRAGFHLDGPAANPLVKDRDNALLARLLTADGTVRLLVDPSCRRTLAALGGLKRKGRERSEHSHVYDALSYVIHRYHALETPDLAALAAAVHRANASAPKRQRLSGYLR